MKPSAWPVLTILLPQKMKISTISYDKTKVRGTYPYIVSKTDCQCEIVLIYLLKLEANYFTILWWFLPYIDMNQPWVYMCLPVLKPLPTPHPILLGCPSAPALSALFRLELVIYFKYGNIQVQCYSLKSSHPHLFPQSPKDCSVHLCLFCCLAYRGIVTVFLNSIYTQ